MLLSSGKGCLNCQARRKKCDGSRPSCRRCTRAGIECIGYPTLEYPAHSASGSRPKHAQSLARAAPAFVANSSHPVDDTGPSSAGDLGLLSTRHPPIIDTASSTRLETSNYPPPPTQARLSSNTASATVVSGDVPPTSSLETWLDPLIGPSTAQIEESNAPPSQIGIFPHDSYFWLASGQPMTPPYEVTDLPQTSPVLSPTSTLSQSRAVRPMTSGQASLFDALFSLAYPVDEHYRLSTGISQPSQFSNDIRSTALAGPSAKQNLADENVVDPEDTEGVRAIMMKTLTLDRNLKSNSLPFVLECYALWVSRMMFEPLRITTVGREYVLRHYARSDSARQKLMLVSKFARSVAQSTGYDVNDLPTLPTFRDLMSHGYQIANSTNDPVRTVDAANASGAFHYTYELISMSFKILPLSTVLLTMHTAAPVFRRACPDPLDELVHLPSLLLNLDVSLRYYCSLDVLLSVITNRPMFFRYNVEFTTRVTEPMLHIQNFLGVQWLYGVPDRLVVTLARMNAIREDFVTCADPVIISELEMEIGSFKPITGVSASTDPVLTVARVVVQECWRQAAYIYLYMGLCGANIEDARVVTAHSKFMRLFKGVKPARHPDVFLILPIVMLGITTRNIEDRDMIKQRMLNLPECSRPRTLGNEVLQMLDALWAHADASGRPAVWSDLRLACLRVTGM